MGIVGQGSRREGAFGLGPGPGLVASDDGRPDGFVSGAGQLDPPGGGDDLADRHLVLGEGAGLVGGDHGDRAEGLHRVEVLHDRVAARHGLHADGEHQRQDRGQALRHCRHRQGDPEQQDVDGLVEGGDPVDGGHHDHDHDGDADDEHAQGPGYLGDLALQRGGFVGGLVQQRRDAPHLGVHAGSGDDGPPHTPGYGGALEHHVVPIPQGTEFRKRGDGLGDRLRLAGERGLLHLQRGGADQARVGGHRVALPQHQDVAGNQVGGGYRRQFAVAQHRRPGGRHVRQGGDGIGGPVLLHETDDGVGQHDQQDDDHVDRQATGPLEEPRRQRDDHGPEQQVDQRIGELLQETPPGGLPRPGAQLVGAVAHQTRGGLHRGQPGPGINPGSAQRLVGGLEGG